MSPKFQIPSLTWPPLLIILRAGKEDTSSLIPFGYLIPQILHVSCRICKSKRETKKKSLTWNQFTAAYQHRNHKYQTLAVCRERQCERGSHLHARESLQLPQEVNWRSDVSQTNVYSITSTLACVITFWANTKNKFCQSKKVNLSERKVSRSASFTVCFVAGISWRLTLDQEGSVFAIVQ